MPVPLLSRLLTLALVALAAYALIAAYAFVVAERVIFQPPPPSYTAADVPYTLVPVDTAPAGAAGAAAAHRTAAAGAAAAADAVAMVHLPHERARFTILFSHGNAEDLGHLYFLLRELHDAGFAVIGYDYRGYGRSTGSRATARQASADAEAVYRHAVGTLGIAPERLIVHGRSLGSGPTLELAARHDVAGVVLESAFTSAYRVVTRRALLPFDRFRNITHVRSLERPVLVIHGTRDRVIPWSHGQQLFAAAPGPKQALWVEGAGHDDIFFVARDRYLEALHEFTHLLDGAS